MSRHFSPRQRVELPDRTLKRRYIRVHFIRVLTTMMIRWTTTDKVDQSPTPDRFPDPLGSGLKRIVIHDFYS